MPLPIDGPEDIRYSALAKTSVFVGTPDQVAEKIDQFCNDYTCTDFILSSHFAGMNPKKSGASNALFAKYVMPRFADA